MEFTPPRCPNPECRQHALPASDFFERRGRFRPRCRIEPVPRFRCRTCGKSFSRQTFRHDYRDRRPECNEPLFLLLISGVGMRQCGRLLRLDIHSVVKKKRKLAHTCAQLHQSLSRRLPTRARTFLLDEEETYEGASIRPLTMPVVIEKDAWFVVATEVGSIRRLARPGTARRRRQDIMEAKCGRRPDESRVCVHKVLSDLATRIGERQIVLQTDEKASYGRIARKVFGERVVHETTSGARIRATHNPLFAINTTMAMTRDNCGRLRRRSWLVSKRADRLREHLALFTVYRNYVRRRFNRDLQTHTPARVLELLPRALTAGEIVAWRQDWGPRSVHPMSHLASRTIGA